MSANKKLVALAALTVVSGLAHAESQLKVYGYLEAALGSFKPVGEQSITKVQSGDMMTSFIGFAGTEDLGGGLKAEFALESFIGNDTGANITNQAGQFWSRTSWVGLSGGFGRLALGQYDTPLFTAGYTYNPFGSSMTYSPTMRHFYNLGSTASSKLTNLSQADTGWVNSVTYETPVVAGFSGIVQFSPKESANAQNSNSYTVGGSYNGGPLSLMAVYVDAGTSPKIGSAAVSPYPTEFRAANFNASYDFGVLKAFGQYTRFKYYDNAPLSVGNLAGVTKANVWQVGVSVPVTASGTVLASYGAAKYKAVGDDTSDKILSLGYDHALSKRTSLYAAFTSEKLSDFKGGRALGLGVKHNF
ncbi:MAG: porin [Proteobacteria bacterium]|uniref:porin n=1 Tax=Aquabacterium sp. TaxID=1872578 RepID=UPI0035C6A11F|nr:porin [Pseudomonadota bacterium]